MRAAVPSGVVVVTGAVIASVNPRAVVLPRGGVARWRVVVRAAAVGDGPDPADRYHGLRSAALDCNGRIGDRTPLHAPGWAPGARVHITGARQLATVRACADGSSRVGPQGYVRLPASVRHVCGLRPGDRVVLAADPDRQKLRVYPPAGFPISHGR